MTEGEEELIRQESAVAELAAVIAEHCPRRDGDDPDTTEAEAIIAKAAALPAGGYLVATPADRNTARAFAQAAREAARKLASLPSMMRPRGAASLLGALDDAQAEAEWRAAHMRAEGRTGWQAMGVYRECRAVWLRRGRASSLPRTLNPGTHQAFFGFCDAAFDAIGLQASAEAAARAFAERAGPEDVGDFEAWAVGALPAPPGCPIES